MLESGKNTRILALLCISVIVTGAAMAFGHPSSPTVDDSNLQADFDNTTSSTFDYDIEVAFLGDPIAASSPGSYNLTNESGGLVDEVSSGVKLKTGGNNSTTEDRYYFWNLSNNQSTPIDLLSSSHDVSGRINNSSKLVNPEVEVRYWKNGSLLVNSSNDQSDNRVNISNISEWQGESIYRLNTSLQKYWIGYKANGKAPRYHPSRGIKVTSSGFTIEESVKKPRVNDFQYVRNGTNVTGKLLNSTGTSDASGIEVKLSKTCEFRARCYSRFPYQYTPLTRTDITNSSGHFRFTGLDPGSNESRIGYKLEVENHSVALSSSNFFLPDFVLENSTKNSFNVGNYSVTGNVGHLDGSISGNSSRDYGLAAFSSSLDSGPGGNGSAYLEPQENLSDISLSSLPNGTYSVVAVEFKETSSAPTDIVSRTVEVKDGENKTVNFEFPEEVIIKGNVTNSGSGVANATLTVRNRSEFSYYSTETDSNGSYSLKVTNDTGYTVEAKPPRGKDLTTNSTTVDVNKASQTVDISLGSGSELKGRINDSGGPVSARVTVSRDTETSFEYSSTRTNSSGEYSIGGLKNGTKYELDVYPTSPGKSEVHTEVTLNEDKYYNYTLNSSTAKIYGFIESESSGNDLNAKVTLVNERQDTEKSTRTNKSGGYSFTDLSQGTFYRLKVRPENKSYSTGESSVYLSEDTRENFSLAKFSGVDGYVSNASSNLSNADVFVYNFTTRNYGFSTTDSSGYYSIDVPAGSYNIEARKEGYPSNSTTVTVTASGTDRKDINLAAGATVSGYIKDNGKTSYNGSIGFYNLSENSFGYTRFENGDYSVEGLMKDVGYNVWINVEKEGYEPVTRTIDKPKNFNNPKNWTVTGNNGQKLEVKAQYSNFTGIKGVEVTTGSSENSTNSDGIAKFGKQPVGNITIRATKDGFEGVQKEVSISQPSQLTPKTKRVNVTLSPVTEIKVDVNVTRNSTGNKSVSDASVVFFSNESGVAESSSAVTGSDGRATVDGLVEGSYLLTLAVDENTVVNGGAYLNESKGWRKKIPLANSDYNIWYEAER